MKAGTLALTIGLSLGLTAPGVAQTLSVSGGTLDVKLAGTRNATLTVTGPNDYYRQTFSPDKNIALNLAGLGRLADGIYTYEITAATGQTKPVTAGLDNGRGALEPSVQNVGVTVAGTFQVKNGAIVVTPAASGRVSNDSDG
jgi:hypothetical protein